MPLSTLIASAVLLSAAAAPAGAAPAPPMQAMALWIAAYDGCYAPAHFSLGVDRPLTVRCIERSLRKARADAPAALHGPLDGLIRETPRLVDALHASEAKPPAAGGDARAEPPAPPASRRAEGGVARRAAERPDLR